MKPKILLTGAYGQIGWELQRTLSTLGHVIACNHAEFDLGNPDQMVKQVRLHAPDVIVNAAAYTAVDIAEKEQDVAMQVNGTAPGLIAEEATRLGAWLIHFSTDYVFDGTKRSPYTEEMQTNPLNVYGKTKLKGEENVAAASNRHLILRTSWIYGDYRTNFLLAMLDLAEKGQVISAVSDQIGGPTWSRQVAQMTAQLIQQVGHNPESENLSGIYHLTAGDQASRYELAEAIFRCRQSLTGKAMPKMKAVTSDKFPKPAKRPSYSVLSNKKLFETFNVEIPAWEEGLRLCMAGMFARAK
jgi:dTDP-4-dehydrorhamnose reductase